MVDSGTHKPTVGLDLRLARTSCPNAATKPLQVRPLPGEARQEVLELSEFDLEASFVSARALGENVEDGAVVSSLTENAFSRFRCCVSRSASTMMGLA
jgi:hypothetical protein